MERGASILDTISVMHKASKRTLSNIETQTSLSHHAVLASLYSHADTMAANARQALECRIDGAPLSADDEIMRQAEEMELERDGYATR
jgi:hypothetical protein